MQQILNAVGYVICINYNIILTDQRDHWLVVVPNLFDPTWELPKVVLLPWNWTPTPPPTMKLIRLPPSTLRPSPGLSHVLLLSVFFPFSHFKFYSVFFVISFHHSLVFYLIMLCCVLSLSSSTQLFIYSAAVSIIFT